MKNKLEKIYNITTSTAFSIYALVALILTIFLPKYNIFFKGWWTLFLIIPSLGNVLFHKNKASNLYILLIGILILLSSYNILSLNKCFTILLCLGIILLGINIVKATIRIPQKNNSSTDYVPYYYAFLGVTEEKISAEFKGGTTKVLFGNIILDLSEAQIINDTVLNVLSVFGETTIILPDNTLVETRNTNILGGTENTKKTSKQNKKASKIFIDSMSILGSTKIK